MTSFIYTHLARAASLDEVQPGQVIDVDVDLVLAHDGTGPKLLQAWDPVQNKVFDGRRVLFTVDHAFPAPSPEERMFQKNFAAFAQHEGCTLYNHGEGVLHQVVAERAALWPGMIIAGADGHVATAGAFGAIAFSLSPEELIPVLTRGKLKLKVPEVVTIAIEGNELPFGVLARDISFYLFAKLGEKINGKAVILSGTFFETASPDSKMAVCNLLPEGGAVTACVVSSEDRDKPDYTLNIRDIESMVAVPPSPTSVKTRAEVKGTPVNVAIIGGCSSGRIEDMEVVAKVFEDEMVHPDVTLIVTPASQKVAKEMAQKGITSLLLEKGALVMPPGCGPCPGKHFGVLAPGDVAIATTIRNNPGRIGSPDAQIYLASPLTVARAAVNGKIE